MSKPKPRSTADIRFECTASGWQHFASETWGSCRRYIEVGDDQLATRQVEIYDNGRVLVYDRKRPRDENGRLIGLRFSKKDKWAAHFENVRMLSADEFEAVWRAHAPDRSRECRNRSGQGETNS